MQTPKEIFLELLQPDGHPERMLKQYEALHLCLTDPINILSAGQSPPGHRQPGPLGHHHQLSGGCAGCYPRPYR